MDPSLEPAPWAATTRQSRNAPVIGNTSALRRGVGDDRWFITVPVELPGKDRHRSGNGHHYATARQVNAEALVKRCAIEQNAGRTMIEGPVRISVVVSMATTVAKRIGQPMDMKPDLDNLAKLLFDGLNGAGVWRDDCRIAEMKAMKLYGSEARTVIMVEPCLIVPHWASYLLAGETVH